MAKIPYTQPGLTLNQINQGSQDSTMFWFLDALASLESAQVSRSVGDSFKLLAIWAM